MPGLVSNPKHIVTRVTNVHISEFNQTFELFSASKSLREIFPTKTNLTYIKVTHTVIGMSRWCQAARRL